MKKIVILALAAIFALIGSELIVAKIIGYPTYGVEMKMTGIRGLSQAEYIYKPFSEYWTAEGGYRVYRRNNIGLTGGHVRVADDSRYVFVLGSSYMEAAQLPPEKIAVALLQEKLRATYPRTEVINLGAAGYDAYDLFWRADYFEKKYPPDHVFLVVEKMHGKWLARHRQPLDFDGKNKVQKPYHSTITNMARQVVNRSSFLNLLYAFLRPKDKATKIDKASVPAGKSGQKEMDEKNAEAFFACLKNYKAKYGGRFSVIAILDDKMEYAAVKGFSEANGIQMARGDLNRGENRINEKGHLNAKGNLLLAELLYEAFSNHQKK